jgi:formylmethanofuran dehydrogenase subunit C
MASENTFAGSQILSESIAAKNSEANPVQLRLKEELKLPLEAEVLAPDVIGVLSRAEIQELPVMLGKRLCRLSDFFEVEGERSRCLELHGNLSKVKWIGRGMSGGSIAIHGNAGMHLGAAMSGGSIVVHGNTADWLGAEMLGGRIRIHGNAGGQVGAAYRGSRKGMRGGTILIDGNAGLEVAMLCGRAGLRSGAWMSRGTIIVLEPLQLLPTFVYACTYEPDFLRLITKELSDSGLNDLGQAWNYQVKRYVGDTSGLGKGEILLCAPN